MKRVLLLFDVDGTLSYSQRPVLRGVLAELRRISQNYEGQVDIGIVSGSDEEKVRAQFNVADLKDMFRGSSNAASPLIDFCFFENGLVSFSKDGDELKQLSLRSFRSYLGDEQYTELVDFILYEFSQIKLPVKTSRFVELRNGTLNVSPLGRKCSVNEREEFAALDQRLGIREKLRLKLTEALGEKMGLSFVTGGQISIDIFPTGWDKSYCLNHVNVPSYTEIHFLGDRCVPGGNDYALYSDERVTHPLWVRSPLETEEWLRKFKA